MINFFNNIPLGMFLSVERNDYTKPASRQGCIPNGMQEINVVVFSTERCIPNGIPSQKFKQLQDIYFMNCISFIPMYDIKNRIE